MQTQFKHSFTIKDQKINLCGIKGATSFIALIVEGPRTFQMLNKRMC